MKRAMVSSEDAHDSGREEGGDEIDFEPGKATAHREANWRERALGGACADHGLNVRARFLLRNLASADAE